MYILKYFYNYFNKLKLNALLESKSQIILLEWINGASKKDIYEKYGDFGEVVLKTTMYKKQMLFKLEPSVFYYPPLNKEKKELII